MLGKCGHPEAAVWVFQLLHSASGEEEEMILLFSALIQLP